MLLFFAFFYLLAMTGSAEAMPQLVAMALFQIGAPMALATWFATSAVASFLVTTAVTVGLQLAANALLRGQVNVPKPSDGQTEVRQPLAPRTTSYGRVRVSGAVWWLDAITTVLYIGITLNHRRIGGIRSYHIDENEVDLNGSFKVTTSPYSANNVFIYSRLGNTPETSYSQIETGFGVEEVRGDGVASLLATIQNPATSELFQDAYPNGRPLLRATIDSTCVYDPREAAHDVADETTWEYSDNWALCLMDFLKSKDGFGIEWELIEANMGEWLQEIAICDEQMELSTGGFGPRYKVAGTHRLTDDPIDVVRKFEAAADARIWERRDGSIGVIVGKFRTPSVCITDADIVVLEGMMFGQDPVNAIEGVRGEYMAPDFDYREHEADPWPNGEEVLLLEDERTVTLDLLYCPSGAQARRLMKRAYYRAHSGWRGKVTTNLAGLEAMDERFVHLQIAELEIDESFEVERFTIDFTTMTCELEVRAVGEDIDDWDPSEEGESAGSFTFEFFHGQNGTTLDPIADAGATAGQLVVVFAGNGTSVPATPAGWTLIQKQTTTMFMGQFYRVLDGTEGAITFNTASGPIVAAVFSAPGSLTIPQLAIAYANSGDNLLYSGLTAPDPVSAIMSSVLWNGNITDTTKHSFLTTTKVVFDEDEIIQGNGSLSLSVNLTIWNADEIPESNFYVRADNAVANRTMGYFMMSIDQ